jgi:hypothetical protein
MNKINLQKLGYDEWIGSVDNQLIEGEFSPARVIEVNKNSFVIQRHS